MNYRNILFVVLKSGLLLLVGYYIGLNKLATNWENMNKVALSMARNSYYVGCMTNPDKSNKLDHSKWCKIGSLAYEERLKRSSNMVINGQSN
jgi:hypothetical protein